MGDLAKLARQPDLAERDDVGRQWMVDQRADDGEAHRQIAARLGEPDPAHDGREHLVLTHRQPCPPLEHGQQQCQPTRIETLCAAPRRHAGVDLVGQCLDLDHQWSMALERRADGGAGDAGAPVGEEQAAGVGYPHQAALDHLEHTQFIGRTEAMLHRAQQSQSVVPIAFEAEHRVDDVFEHARACEATVFGDVPDEHHRDSAPFGLGNQAMGAATNLHDAAGGEPTSGSATDWMLSMMTSCGCAVSKAAMTCGSEVSASNHRWGPRAPSRSARSRTC